MIPPKYDPHYPTYQYLPTPNMWRLSEWLFAFVLFGPINSFLDFILALILVSDLVNRLLNNQIDILNAFAIFWTSYFIYICILIVVAMGISLKLAEWFFDWLKR